MTQSFPTTGRLAAVDHGTVRIGVAISDPDRRLVSPLAVYQRRDEPRDRQYFIDLAKEERIVAWIVGLPIHADGRESESSARSRVFARWLRQATALPVRLFDERFTSAAAQLRLNQRGMTRKQQKQRLDAIAAQVMLDAFLEAMAARPGELPGRPADGPVGQEEPESGLEDSR